MKIHRVAQLYTVTISLIAVGADPLITTDDSHGLKTGDIVTIAGVNATLTGTDLNVAGWEITSTPLKNTFKIKDSAGAVPTTGGSYTAATDTVELTSGADKHHPADTHTQAVISQEFGVDDAPTLRNAGLSACDAFLFVEATIQPAAGEEVDVTLFGRPTEADTWFELVQVTEASAFVQHLGDGNYTFKSASVQIFPFMKIVLTPTSGADNVINAAICASDRGL